MTITEQKAAQRKAGIAARRALSDTERTRSNAALCCLLYTSPSPRDTR